MENVIRPFGSPPRGWHAKNKFIDDIGNVFKKGKFLYDNEQRIFFEKILNLEKRIAELTINKKNKQKIWDYSCPWDEYIKLTKIEDDEISKLDRELRLIRPYKLEDIPDYGDVMTLNQFKNNVKNGGFVDYDGYGHYIDGDKMTDIIIYPSDVKHHSLRHKLNKIIWFNK